jgi:carbon-monoxide dehydrogenase medium subunit
MLGVAAVVTLEGRKCTAASVAIGGLTPRPLRAPSVEAALKNKVLDEPTLTTAAGLVGDDLGNALGDFLLGDLHASADYRKAMAPVYIRRALQKACERVT